MSGTAWSILCDFDGTITLQDVTDALLERFARPGWQDLETAWREGRIGSRVCMAGQVALLDCTRQELDAFLATMAIDAHFAEFVAAARDRGMAVEIVSDGLDYACRAILERHGVRGVPMRANRLVQCGERGWRLEFPHAAPTCRSDSGTCKCARITASAFRGRPRVLVVGDGASDFCMASRASLVFARGALLSHCRDHGLAHRNVESFADAIGLLPQIDSMMVDATVSEPQWAI